jgi:hypothetical protein
MPGTPRRPSLQDVQRDTHDCARDKDSGMLSNGMAHYDGAQGGNHDGIGPEGVMDQEAGGVCPSCFIGGFDGQCIKSNEPPCHHKPHKLNHHVAKGMSITIICGRVSVMPCGFVHEFSD